MIRTVTIILICLTPIILIVSYVLTKGLAFFLELLDYECKFFTKYIISDDTVDTLGTLVKIFVFVILTIMQYFILYMALCFSMMLYGD